MGRVKLWHLIAAAAGASLLYANIAYYREWNQRVPVWAGRVCDDVWAKTRTTEPTVRWYHACIRQVAIERKKALRLMTKRGG